MYCIICNLFLLELPLNNYKPYTLWNKILRVVLTTIFRNYIVYTYLMQLLRVKQFHSLIKMLFIFKCLSEKYLCKRVLNCVQFYILLKKKKFQKISWSKHFFIYLLNKFINIWKLILKYKPEHNCLTYNIIVLTYLELNLSMIYFHSIFLRIYIVIIHSVVYFFIIMPIDGLISLKFSLKKWSTKWISFLNLYYI